MVYLTMNTAPPYQFIITENLLKFLALLCTTIKYSASTIITLTDQTHNFKRHSINIFTPAVKKKTPL